MDTEPTAPPAEPPASERMEDDRTALVIVWTNDEPERLGEVAILPSDGKDSVLGRSDDGAARRVRFVRQRPDGFEPCSPISSIGISREQLLVRVGAEGLLVVRKGLPRVLVNGADDGDSVVVRPGDTLEIDRQMLFLCVRRPVRMQPLRYATIDASFGAPDADGIIGESPAAWKLREDIGYARHAVGHVFITGESGTGKELAARGVHSRSARADKPFVSHNAATFPPGLIDSELFGNLRNYPNPGMPERPGLVGEANGGVLFLDEIGELPPDLHSRLLRVLDSNGEYKKLGEATVRTSDFRLVAATNRDPSVLKHDLFSRLSIRIGLPNLRERREDVPLLARALVLDAARLSPRVAGRFVSERAGRQEVRMSPALAGALVRWDYSTNMREISVLLSYAVAQSTGDVLGVPKEMRDVPAVSHGDPSTDRARQREVLHERVRAVLAQHRGNVSRAAEELGVSRAALYRLMKKYGVSGE